MYLLQTSTQALGGKVSTNPNREKKSAFPHFTASISIICPIPAVQAEHDRCLWKLSELGQLWDPFQCLPQPPKASGKPWTPPAPPIPTPYLRSVLSAREMAGFLTALEQAALLLQRENSSERIWGNSDSVMGTPCASSKACDRHCCHELPVPSTNIRTSRAACLLPGTLIHQEFQEKSGIILHYTSTQDKGSHW